MQDGAPLGIVQRSDGNIVDAGRAFNKLGLVVSHRPTVLWWAMSSLRMNNSIIHISYDIYIKDKLTIDNLSPYGGGSFMYVSTQVC